MQILQFCAILFHKTPTVPDKAKSETKYLQRFIDKGEIIPKTKSLSSALHFLQLKNLQYCKIVLYLYT